LQIRAREALRISAWVFGSALLAYFLFARFAFEPLVRWYLPRVLAERSGHHLTLGRVRLAPFQLSVEVRGLTLTEPDNKPLLALDRLFVDFDGSSLFKGAYAFDEVRVTAPRVRVELLPDGRLNWQALLDAFSGPPRPRAEPEAPPPRLVVELAALEDGQIDFADNRVKGGFKTRIGPLQAQLLHLSTLPADSGEHTLSARTEIGAQVRWKGKVGLNPLAADGEVSVDDLALAKLWRYMESTLRVVPPDGVANFKLGYHAGYADRVFDVRVDGLDVNLQKLALKGLQDTEASVALDSLQLSGGHLDLVRREAGFESIRIDGGRLAVEIDAGDRPRVREWLAPPSTAASGAAESAAPWRFQVAKVNVDRVALHAVNRAFVEPLTIDATRLRLGLQAQVALGAGAPEIDIKDLGIELSGIRLSNKLSPKPLLELATLGLEEGQLSLSERQLSLGRVFASGGRIVAARDARGRMAVVDAMERVPAPPMTAAVAAAPPWRYKIGKLQADDFDLTLSEESVKPAARLGLQGLHAEADGFSDDVKAMVPVKLGFKVREGGRFEASGRLQPASQTGELRFDLSDLSLTSVQPFVAQKTALVLAGGRASMQGRLQLGEPRLDASFAVKNLLLNEADTGERFLGWKSLSGKTVLATPGRVDLNELSLDGVGAKLIIFKDRTTNVAKLLRPPGAPPPAAPASAASSPVPAAAAGEAAPAKPAAAATKAPPAFQFNLGRARISDGSMEFADLSLALPFGTSIHHLNGFLANVSSQPGAVTQLELDGKVDEFGLARAVGQIEPSAPADFTDIKVVFRNVEMAKLTPYSATFAGRKIESGKLSLDLEYKVKQRQLLGDNKIILDKLVLGERVESASAKNLPLDLAIAMLQDSDGKIDLGLPVSGSLDDPQFSYGALVWKAIGNVLTKIVTAPFHALGAMLGIDADKLDKIVFDAGSSELLPPEREKLLKTSRLLAKRPTLVLSVHGDYSSQVDGEAIKNLRLRRAVALQMGRKLGDGEDPGPFGTTDAASREALEKLFAQRFGGDALAAMKERHAQANPEAPPGSATGRMMSRLSPASKAAPEPLTAEQAQPLRGADLHALLAQRLMEADTVDEALLRQIGATRGEAIRRELTGQGLAAERVKLPEPRQQDGAGTTVTVEIGVEAPGRQPAEGAASAPTALKR
jgi:hypothetical protein